MVRCPNTFIHIVYIGNKHEAGKHQEESAPKRQLFAELPLSMRNIEKKVVTKMGDEIKADI